MKTAEEITNIMGGIAINSFQLTIDRENHHRVAQLEEKDDLKTMIMTLMQKVEAISTSSQKEATPPFIQGNVNQEREVEEVSFMGRQGYQGLQGNFGQGRQGQFQPQGQQKFQPQGQFHNQGQGRYNPPNYQSGQGNQAYNPNQRKHDNFSYANQKAARAKPLNNEGKPTNEDALALILKRLDGIEESGKLVAQQFKNLETQVNQQQKNMEFQIGQLATTVGHMQNKGKFPSTMEPNPREHCKAVELRSGKRYDGPPMPVDVEEETIEQEIDQEKEAKEQDEAFEERIEDEESKKKEKEEVQDEVTKKNVEKEESSKRVPKWKVAKELRDKKGLDVECDEWGIPKTLIPPPYPKRECVPMKCSCLWSSLLGDGLKEWGCYCA
ncbi:hypothetical protein ACS0TY_024161 [Phlomoides rotata]